jgi:ATP synthase F1 delta subunit
MSKASKHVIARVITAKLLAEPDKRQKWVKALAAYLVANDMTGQVDLIINDIARELFRQEGQLVVEVTSAQELSAEMQRQLTEFLRSETAAKAVELYKTVNPELIGGLIARTPDAELDISVRRSLRQLATVV